MPNIIKIIPLKMVIKKNQQQSVNTPTSPSASANALPRIGITVGDFNGIGIEIIIKVLQDSRMLKFCTPVIYGSSKIISRYKKLLSIESFNYQQIAAGSAPIDKRINVVNCWEDNYELQVGKVREEAGRSAYLAIAQSSADLRNGLIDGVVTAPINKANIQSPEFPYPGHTEYYHKNFAVKEESLMLLISNNFRIGTVTGHLPLSKVVENITKEKIINKLYVLIDALKLDFQIKKPKIAVLGLNPHAGEDGLLGNEEKDIILPALQVLKKRNHLVFGPFPADGFFGMHQYHQYDAVLAMYHDQGLIPFKMMAFESGVNYTAGLSVVRTSPDHGTAYSIAGKGIADDSSFRSAVFMACEIIKNRAAAHYEVPKTPAQPVPIALAKTEDDYEE